MSWDMRSEDWWLESRRKQKEKKMPFSVHEPTPVETPTSTSKQYPPIGSGSVIGAGGVGGSVGTTGTKFDQGKLRWDLIPPEFEEVIKVITFGARKYTDRNWEKGINYSRLFGAVMRHLWAFLKGETRDPESGLHPLAHAACDIIFLLTYERRMMGKDFNDLVQVYPGGSSPNKMPYKEAMKILDPYPAIIEAFDNRSKGWEPLLRATPDVTETNP